MAQLARFAHFERVTKLGLGFIPIGILALGLAPSPIANAKASYDSPYSFEQTWNASLRLVRVDLGLKVTEKDNATGYILFEYRSSESGAKSSPGSIELVRPKELGGQTHVVASLPQMPRYHEQVFVDALARKLREEFGEPPKRLPKPPESKPDAGAPAD